MDKLLAKLSEQQAAIREHNDGVKMIEDDFAYSRVLDHQSSSSSLPITPASEPFPGAAPTARSASATPNDSRVATEEVLRLKLELAQAQTKISRLDQELAQTRLVKTESGRVTPVITLDSEYSSIPGLEQVATRAPAASATKAQMPRDNAWPPQDDSRSDTSDTLSAGGFSRSRTIWGNGKSNYQNSLLAGAAPVTDGSSAVSWQAQAGRGYNPGYIDTGAPPYGPSPMDGYRPDRLTPDQDVMMRPSSGRRGHRYDNRFGSSHTFAPGYGGGYNLNQTQYDPAPYSAGPTGPVSSTSGTNMYPQYQQQAVGTALSPHATEFTSAAGSAWKMEVSTAWGPLCDSKRTGEG